MIVTDELRKLQEYKYFASNNYNKKCLYFRFLIFSKILAELKKKETLNKLVSFS